MCEIHDTADKLGTGKPDAIDAINTLHENLSQAKAVADLLNVSDKDISLMDGTLSWSIHLLLEKIEAVRASADVMHDAIRTLERQLSEIADAKELLRKRDRLREILARKTHKEALDDILEPDEGE